MHSTTFPEGSTTFQSTNPDGEYTINLTQVRKKLEMSDKKGDLSPEAFDHFLGKYAAQDDQ